MEVSPHTLSLQQTLKGVENKLQFLGTGPHTPQQAEEFQKLTNLKQKLLEQIQGDFFLCFICIIIFALVVLTATNLQPFKLLLQRICATCA